MADLVFLPGAAGLASFWRPVAERLHDLGRAHLLGYPGFGAEPADPGIRSLADLHRWVLARLPAGASTVVAQSMGGILAARLAIEEPSRVSRLVLCATSGGVDVRRLGAAGWRDEYRAALPDAPPWFVDDRTDLTERLAAIRAPTLLLWSDSDPISPLAVGRFLEGRIARARLVTVAGGGHAFAAERPDEVAAHVRAHLAGSAPADPRRRVPGRAGPRPGSRPVEQPGLTVESRRSARGGPAPGGRRCGAPGGAHLLGRWSRSEIRA